jgi:hypothetical protein
MWNSQDLWIGASRGLSFTSWFIGSFDEFAVLEACSGSDEGDQVGGVDRTHRCWADSISFNAIAIPATREPGALVTRCRSLTVAKVDSIARDQTSYGLSIIPGKVRPITSPRRGGSTGSDHCSRHQSATRTVNRVL